MDRCIIHDNDGVLCWERIHAIKSSMYEIVERVSVIAPGLDVNVEDAIK